MHLRLCLLLALGCIASSQRFQQARGLRRPGGPAGRGPGGPRGSPRRALLGAPEVQRRGPGPVLGGVPDSFARRQSASIRPGQGERRYQVFTDPTQVQLNKAPEQRPVAQAQRVLRPVERRQERPQEEKRRAFVPTVEQERPRQFRPVAPEQPVERKFRPVPQQKQQQQQQEFRQQQQKQQQQQQEFRQQQQQQQEFRQQEEVKRVERRPQAEEEADSDLAAQNLAPVYGNSIERASVAAHRDFGGPAEQRDIESAVHAGAAAYTGESYNNPQRLSFQIHGQDGPHSYRYGYDTGVGYNRQFKYEERDNYGVLHGRYGFYDQEGKLQVVNYSADPQKGFHAEGDHVPKRGY